MLVWRKRGSAAKHIFWRECIRVHTHKLANGSYACTQRNVCMCVALTLTRCTCELRPGQFYFCITRPGKRDPDRRGWVEGGGGGGGGWRVGGMLHSNPQPTHRRLLGTRPTFLFQSPAAAASECHFAQRRCRVIDGNGDIKLLLWCQGNHFSHQLSSHA
jgi:hypothetical protein